MGALVLSSVGAVEGAAKITGKYPLLKLSFQQILDCCPDCAQSPDATQRYIEKYGLEKEADYKKGSSCGYNASKVAVKVVSFANIPKNEESLKNVTASTPIFACVAAASWQSYRSGILSKCPGSIDHCIEVVGYDFANNPPYWILQNSWGAYWGESGYIRIEAGKNLCKISDDASYALVAF